MEIVSSGYDVRCGGDFCISRPQGLDHFLLLLVRSRAVFEIDGERMETMPYSLFLFERWKPHRFYATGERFVNDWVSFQLTAAEETALRATGVGMNRLLAADVFVCESLLRLIQLEMRKNGGRETDDALTLLRVLLHKVGESAAPARQNEKYYPEMKRLREWIYANPWQRSSVAELSARIPVSPPYFQTLYRRFFDSTPLADAIESRVSYAKQLLSTTDYSIAAVASAAGYGNAAQFIKQFRELVGISPRKYRMDGGARP